MLSSLSGRVSLVTGSGRGIGKAIVLKLAGMGSGIVVNDLPDSKEAAAKCIWSLPLPVCQISLSAE